jgi:hypothetical protein
MSITYEEILQLFKETNRQSQATDQQIKELLIAQKETDRKFQATDQQIKELLIAQKETDRKFKETDHKFKETDHKFKETDRQLKELGKQIGGLGQKFGSFTEGLALPSMEKILRHRFQMEVISPSVRVSKHGQHMEIDVLAYTNGEINAVYVVEVKSHGRSEAIEQLITLLSRFRDYFPEHRDKKVFGILAVVDLPASVREQVLQAGLYVARIHDEVFELDVPDDFQPRVW